MIHSTQKRIKLNSHVSLQPLKLMSVEARFAHLPTFLQALIQEAATKIALEELIVFGSRARGDEKPMSDWDLCFKFPAHMTNEWLKFSLDLPEKAETLLEIDAVSWNEATAALRANIQQDGLVVWKR